MSLATHFREYTDRDLPELEAMVLALYREDEPGDPMSVEKVHRTVRVFTAHPEMGRIVILCCGEAVAGYAILTHHWSNEHGGSIVVLDEIYVKPAWRGRGIATALLRHGAVSGQMPIRGLQVEVTPGNQQALAYYRKQGFSPAANRHLFKRLPH